MTLNNGNGDGISKAEVQFALVSISVAHPNVTALPLISFLSPAHHTAFKKIFTIHLRYEIGSSPVCSFGHFTALIQSHLIQKRL